MNAQATTSVSPGKSAQTRQKLIDAGIELFSEFGYDATSTRRIEARAQVQRNLISYHFGSKQEFWKACMTELFARVDDSARTAFSHSRDIEPKERMRFLIRRFVRWSAAHPEVARVMFDEGRHDDWRLEWLVDNYARQLYETVTGQFEEGRQQGVVPNLSAAQFYYVLVSSAGIFGMAPECRRLSGEDPCESAFVDRHADAVAQLLTSSPEQRHRS